MESITKKDRVYLTSKAYLSRVKIGCALMLASSIALISASLFIFGLSPITIFFSVFVLGMGLILCRFVIRGSKEASFKGDNLILSNLRNRHVVAPVGSIRKVKSRGVFGMNYTRVSYKLDGSAKSFMIFGKESSTVRKPEEIIREEMANARRRKKMANHKPDSVLTQSA